MSNMTETLASLKKLSSEKIKVVHDVYNLPIAPAKQKRPIVDKNLIWKLFQKHKPTEFILNETNNEIIYTILLYFLKDPNFDKYGIIKNDASNEKGLLIYGDYGVGKTEIFKIIRKIGRELCKIHCYDFWFPEVSAGSFVEEYMASTMRKESTFKLDEYYKGKLYIDDLGYERKAFNRDEILGNVLFERNRNGCRTFVTTNLTPTAISDKYGQRIGDRLPEMFNIISWKGESFRK